MLKDIYMFNSDGNVMNPGELKSDVISIAKHHGVGLNLEKPVTIQDKLSWLMIYDCNNLKTKCADKYLLREYCVEKLGKDICLPLLGVYSSTKEIDWGKLPNEFVIKCNHGSGMNFVVKDKSKANKSEIYNKLEYWLMDNFALRNTYEAQYYNIRPKIVVEKLMKDEKQQESLFDYKFWCFNGEPKLYTINDGHGHGDIMYYNMDGSENNLYGVKHNNTYKKPINFSIMVDYAKKLSNPFKFVRVDFYEVNDEVYLGELTFTPGCGYFKYKNPDDDKKIGNLLIL